MLPTQTADWRSPPHRSTISSQVCSFRSCISPGIRPRRGHHGVLTEKNACTYTVQMIHCGSLSNPILIASMRVFSSEFRQYIPVPHVLCPRPTIAVDSPQSLKFLEHLASSIKF